MIVFPRRVLEFILPRVTNALPLPMSLRRMLIFFPLENVSTLFIVSAHVHFLVFVAWPLVTLASYAPWSPVLCLFYILLRIP